MSPPAILRGLIGSNAETGSIFASPDYVDLSKPPGHTSLFKKHFKPNWFLAYYNPINFLYGPGFLWCLIAILGYLLVPYDFEAERTKNFTSDLLLERIVLHTAIVWLYTGFWHVTLYSMKWGKRKYNPTNTGPTLGRLCHNIWYATLGAIQCGVWDSVFAFILANKKFGYTPDSEVFSSPITLAINLLAVVGAQWWRDIHFYFVHRMIHFRFLYKHVHSIHHRNTDVEPFAGLSMHPIEHLYYFSCAHAMVLLGASPFVAFYSLVHCTISPAAGHSGFEDNLQSDTFHFLHHTKFECNYGTVGIPFDYWFGTLRDKFGDNSYAGGADNVPEDPKAEEGKKDTYLSGGIRPVSEWVWGNSNQALFDIICCLLIPYFVYCKIMDRVNGEAVDATFAAFVATWGPVVVGFLFWKFSDVQSWRWPFHNEKIIGQCGLNLGLGLLISVWPIFPIVYLALN
eukprot:TRINITY_DN36789_c0_g1_i1.p1 TRINITY_DN36789_c0_g1~~TRINITY_DN36789_c0_g1_i1.p1  ORF type:complete len:455 (+),score=61.49 TRINITY_DN36789_c0_g1_i1:82-1446(+)